MPRGSTRVGGTTTLARALARAALVSGCSGGSTTAGGASLSREAALGDRIFSDPSLSPSGTMSCATRHDPAHAHASANGLAVQLGGTDGTRQGQRATPSIRYLFASGSFTSTTRAPRLAAFFRDGRSATLGEQAAGPLLGAAQMANASVEDVVAKLSRANCAADFEAVYGRGILADPPRAFAKCRTRSRSSAINSRTRSSVRSTASSTR